jgi:hypothetical protein
MRLKLMITDMSTKMAGNGTHTARSELKTSESVTKNALLRQW